MTNTKTFSVTVDRKREVFLVYTHKNMKKRISKFSLHDCLLKAVLDKQFVNIAP